MILAVITVVRRKPNLNLIANRRGEREQRASPPVASSPLLMRASPLLFSSSPCPFSLLEFKNDIAAALRASPPSMILPLHRCHVHQCFSSDDRILKQKDKLKKHSAPGDSRKEAQAALLILLQSFSTLSSVEVAKQELLEIQEGKSNLKAKEPLLQCIHAYREGAR
ncbi:hypothetical protein S83_064079 [Arachis hypogaea]